MGSKGRRLAFTAAVAGVAAIATGVVLLPDRDGSDAEKTPRCGPVVPGYSVVIEEGKIDCPAARRVARIYLRSGRDPGGWNCRRRSGPFRRGPVARCFRDEKRLLIRFDGRLRGASAF